MHLNEYREVGLGGTFSRQTVVSLLVFGAIWEVLSYFAPALGIPAFAIPSFARIGQSLMSITATDVVVTVARVIGALILSFILGVVLAMAMYRSERLESYLFPIIRLFMAVPVVVLDPVRGAVVSRRGVPHHLRAGRGVRAGLSGRLARCHARSVA
jgi:NitT/TauT family transport system permease protein